MKRRGAVALVGILVASCIGVQLAGATGSGADVNVSGFRQPFAGAPAYEPLGPPPLSTRTQLNQPIGQRRADEIAAAIGLRPTDAFTTAQYLEFIGGRGRKADPKQAALVDESVRIFTNTLGRPLIWHDGTERVLTVLASYGLFVDETGFLQSLANPSAPTRQANSILGPGGYLSKWCRWNGCSASVDALRRSAFSTELPYGIVAQQISGTAQLVKNYKGRVTTTVGMSMVPPIWLVNFALLYILRPSVAAEMPAYWAPIPQPVVDAIVASPSGQVPYSEYAKYLR
jgi:hypothetical protein